ncbi:zn-dependent hydrolases of the beta-lactamase [Diplodia corticola]|uniref:Zn-dependent hydrolases of the beta-lactamase n=1 Tax=Diplodia corticola TaxID=236234 RepID=A0A1J9RRQ7_9PEZI|nr:zn-dependent hydrolases of the beta-lactamase [Diplodia corticola]OJD35219.1 zn-dependent hydrolases of the beta-lactamase [Diplodia corticola]
MSPSAPTKTKTSLSITHIGTATAILSLDGINLLTDPFFSPAGSTWDIGITLAVSANPALSLAQLPPIDAVLLSHDDHVDNLDPPGRTLLDGRRVLTTPSAARNLAPRPGTRGLAPWETVTLRLNGRDVRVTATPTQHLPGGQCTGFLVHHPDGSVDRASGLPNAVWFAGDTVYLAELRDGIRARAHVTAAVLNLGAVYIPAAVVHALDPRAAGAEAEAPVEEGAADVQITMDGRQGARIVRELGAERLVPMHYEAWTHFTQGGEGLRRVFEEEGVLDRVCWLEPGKPVEVL